MRQRKLVLGLSIVLMLAGVKTALPGVAQTSSSPPVLDDANLAEIKQLTQQFRTLYGQGKYEEAIPVVKKMQAIVEKALGKENQFVAMVLNNLALLYSSQGKYTEAELLYKRVLVIYKKILPKDHPEIVTSLNNLAGLYVSQGKYAQAESPFLMALAIRKTALPKDYPEIATSLNNLAVLYRNQGKYEEAISLAKQALDIKKRVLGKNDPSLANILNNLGELYRNKGKYAQAEDLFQEALAITKTALGKNHPSVAVSLNNLGELYRNQGKYAQAEDLFKEALAILKKSQSKEPLAVILNNLARLYDNQKKYAQAELLYKQILAIKEEVLGKDHPSYATSLNNLAVSYSSQGKYSQAELLHKQTMVILEKVLGKDHPDVATNLDNLTLLSYDQGKYAQAVDFHSRGSVIHEKELSKTFVIGSEQDKKDYVDNISISPSFSVNLAINSKRSEADRLALTNVLRRQGRILDATAEIIKTIRTQLANRPDLQKILDDWKITLQEQSTLTVSKLNETNLSEYRARYQELEQRRQELETQLSSQSASFRQIIAPIELAKIQTLVSADAALVHIVKYQSYNPQGGAKNRISTPHYAAAILKSTGNPQWVDLGAAAEIEKNIQTFRTYLQDGSGTNNRQRNQIARTLDAQLMQPLRQYLGNTKHLLLSPDAALNLIPFEALKDENNQYLIERYAFSYLTSGRDLTRFSESPPSRQAPVIFSEINYNKSTNLTPLNTTAETQEIQRVFPNAQITRDQAATKAALQKIQAPSILHLATHGFSKPAKNDSDNSKQFDNPLTRSGIALAGTDQLTGLEAYGLNLYGTQLVVLSACETGLGDISIGEGIYGLRRALVIAGSQSQVLSLWKVGDRATVELMKIFYTNLKTGMGRHEALRDAQLKLLHHPNYQNPSNWAAFIPSGNWEPLQNSSNK